MMILHFDALRYPRPWLQMIHTEHEIESGILEAFALKRILLWKVDAGNRAVRGRARGLY